MHGILHSLFKVKVLLVESQKRVAHRFGTSKTHTRLAERKGDVDHCVCQWKKQIQQHLFVPHPPMKKRIRHCTLLLWRRVYTGMTPCFCLAAREPEQWRVRKFSASCPSSGSSCRKSGVKRRKDVTALVLLLGFFQM